MAINNNQDFTTAVIVTKFKNFLIATAIFYVCLLSPYLMSIYLCSPFHYLHKKDGHNKNNVNDVAVVAATLKMVTWDTT